MHELASWTIHFTLPTFARSPVMEPVHLSHQAQARCLQESVRGSYADALALGSSVHVLVHWQLRRLRSAVLELQTAAEQVHVRDLAQPLSKCVVVATTLEQTLQRLVQVRALASVLDAVDAVCMVAAAANTLADRYDTRALIQCSSTGSYLHMQAALFNDISLASI